MYIHVAQKKPNYTVSIVGLFIIGWMLITKTFEIMDFFEALQNACEAIFEYYDRDGARPIFENLGGQKYRELPPKGVTGEDARGHDLCMDNYMNYYLWFLVHMIIAVVRLESLRRLAKGYLYLRKREIEKQRRKQRKKEKARKDRRRKKKEITKNLMEARNELYRKQQEHLMMLVARNKAKLEEEAA